LCNKLDAMITMVYALTIIIGFFVMFLAGVTQGLTGFGFALVSVPLLMIFLPIKMVVPIVLILSTLVSITILLEARKWVDLKKILPMMVTGTIGVPLGTYLLTVLNVSLLKVFVGSVITLFAVAFLSGFRKKIKREGLAFASVGVISGLLNGSTAMSGPPVILFFTNQDVNKKVFRANLVAYFITLNLVTIPIFIIAGLMSREVVNYAFLFLPGMVLGALTGIKISHRVEEKSFKRIVLVIVMVVGLLSVASGLGIL